MVKKSIKKKKESGIAIRGAVQKDIDGLCFGMLRVSVTLKHDETVRTQYLFSGGFVTMGLTASDRRSVCGHWEQKVRRHILDNRDVYGLDDESVVVVRARLRVVEFDTLINMEHIKSGHASAE